MLVSAEIPIPCTHGWNNWRSYRSTVARRARSSSRSKARGHASAAPTTGGGSRAATARTACNTRTQPGSSTGSRHFRSNLAGASVRLAAGVGITMMHLWFGEPWRATSCGPQGANESCATHFGVPSPRICWPKATAFASSRNCWTMATYARRSSAPCAGTAAAAACAVRPMHWLGSKAQ